LRSICKPFTQCSLIWQNLKSTADIYIYIYRCGFWEFHFEDNLCSVEQEMEHSRSHSNDGGACKKSGGFTSSNLFLCAALINAVYIYCWNMPFHPRSTGSYYVQILIVSSIYIYIYIYIYILNITQLYNY